MEQLWYAAYGSNLSSKRFGHYLGGGRPRGANRHYSGARDSAEPRDDRLITLPGQVYFAGESPTWGGGMAFYDPDGAGSAVGRAYLVTSQQFSDVASQEMRRPIGRDLPLRALFRESRTAVLGPGRYETLHIVGEIDDLPVVTFTASWEHSVAALNAPAASYLRTIADGLAEAYGWSAERSCDYLLARPGVSPTWSPASLLDALMRPAGPVRSPADAINTVRQPTANGVVPDSCVTTTASCVDPDQNEDTMEQNPPTEFIHSAHAAALATLPMNDTRDVEDASRGFMGALEPGAVTASDGTVVWDGDTYAFLDGDAPASVHPSLWRVSKLVAKQGLFEVVEGIYQVRGLDLSNMTIIEGDTGIIVIDPLISTETAAAALALYRHHRGDKPVVAVIYTHSHVDHFGGVFGVTSQADVDAGTVAVIAPEGFVGHAVEENVYAGTAMGRRAGYMYGAVLARGPQGAVGAGLGQTTSTGEIGLIVPTLEIRETGETITVDGVEIEFQMAPGTEAPSEMHFYFPRFRALCMAENATHTLHNILTLRGALVRDPHVWSHYLTEAIEGFAGRTDVVFASHHWPTWGADRIVEFLSIQRDLYAYLHDQTLRYVNKGFTGTEIAEMLQLPPALEQAWSARGYYGSVSHNVKAIYQRYMGWFDGNPARLWQYPPTELAGRYVEAMGGIDAVVATAQSAYDSGDYRWAATLLDHAVFAAPDHAGARTLYAATLEQLGYGAENGTWRNFFLSGSTELREGNFGTPTVTNAPAVLAQLTPDQAFDAMAIAVDAPHAWDLDLLLDWTITDLDTNYRVTLRNGVLSYLARPASSDATATISLAKLRLLALVGGDATSPGIEITGDAEALTSLLGALDHGDPNFNIITP
ncbi:MAG: MBL fold metallo-hydrolase [Humibacillus sp.]|nr:MBL fold metallo-hydrolase [Humibacillus sp.]MDN5779205.1 MBL fold metallo-hydrolase [Humibacillus sp.]